LLLSVVVADDIPVILCDKDSVEKNPWCCAISIRPFFKRCVSEVRSTTNSEEILDDTDVNG
jgi:hypothetical protein